MTELDYGGRKPRLLAVDDEATSLFLMKKIFADEAEITGVSSGKEALTWLIGHEADLVLLDLQMPGMDGFEVLRKMKQQRRLAAIPVIILTGTIEAELEAEGFLAGATDFVRKPIIPSAIRQRVSRVLRYEYLQENLSREVKRQTNLAEERLATTVRLFREMVLALAKTIDAKDKYTHGHSERVAEYSRQIARIDGSSEEVQEEIYTMGLLHDIGKVGIPESIINKPARLTDEEYKIIQSHTVIGSDILHLIKAAPELFQGARYHHERYDGKGYPDGLAGEEIPRTARIIAVADAYDAMTSNRSYRGILPQEAVRREIEKGSGNQFDPQYAAIMLRLIDEDASYRMCETGMAENGKSS